MTGTPAALATLDLNLLAARNQMAVSLGFHIVFAALGVALPAITAIAHWLGLRHGDLAALTLAKRWSKAMALLFAVGAVSGTILSFEMGMLWPGLMGPYGEVMGLPFALEGISFFLEAIFIGIYLYGWTRLPARPMSSTTSWRPASAARCTTRPATTADARVTVTAVTLAA